MSAVLEHIHNLINEAKAEFAKLFGHADAEVAAAAKAGAEKLDEVKNVVEADLPVVEHEAETDAETVAHDAEAAAAPVVTETEHDAESVATEAKDDVEQAVAEATSAPAATEPASETPATSA